MQTRVFLFYFFGVYPEPAEGEKKVKYSLLMQGFLFIYAKYLAFTF